MVIFILFNLKFLNIIKLLIYSKVIAVCNFHYLKFKYTVKTQFNNSQHPIMSITLPLEQ